MSSNCFLQLLLLHHIMFSRSSLQLFKITSSPLLLFHHHHHNPQRPQRQRSPQHHHHRNRKFNNQTTFADAPEQHERTSGSSSPSAMIQPSKFFTNDVVQQHQRNISSSRNSSVSNRKSVDDSKQQSVSSSLFENDQEGTYRKAFSEIDDDEEGLSEVPRGFESRGLQPHIKGRLLSESRNPLDTLPSARLLKKMNYFEALKATSVDELNEEDFERHASSKEAATIRLQSHAHHDKLMFRQHSSGVENEKDPKKSLQKPMFRCQRCFHLFKFSPRKVGNNSLDETRAIRNGFKKDKLFFELEAKYKKRGVVIGSRSLSADPARVNEATCPKCGSGKTESLMQYLHVKNNVRKT